MYKKIRLLLFVAISAVYISVALNNSSFAQDEKTVGIEKKYKLSEANIDSPNDGGDSATNDNSPEAKKDIAYEVLGRKLTSQEKELYGNLSAEELKNQLLYKEQTLVIVRALLVIGEGKDSGDILQILPNTKLRTFTELVNDFTGYKEKYGSVLAGIQSEFVYNIKDDEQAFKKAAALAYETVFGVPKEQQDAEGITNFLKAKQALTYSKMISAFTDSLTPEDKKKMLFKALDSIKRPDLKTNEKFVNKILEQTFTYEALMELLNEIPSSK